MKNLFLFLVMTLFANIALASTIRFKVTDVKFSEDSYISSLNQHLFWYF